MDSNYPLMARPLWFGTPWHGFVIQVGAAGMLRPNGTAGDRDRPWDAANAHRNAAIWDIGRPDPETPEDLELLGGAFLGRSIVGTSLALWRPLLLDGVICRARVQEDFSEGFILQVRAYDPASGMLGDPVTVSTGRFSMDDIGQGAGQPSVSDWTPPAIIRSYSGMDVTPDGRSILVGITPFMSNPFPVIAGLLRLDIGGTPAAPTLSISVVADRAAALGSVYRNDDPFVSETQEWNPPDPVWEDGPCGSTSVTEQGARSPTASALSPSWYPVPVSRTGSSGSSRGFTDRIFTAWFSGGGVHLVRYSRNTTETFVAAAEDMSSGTEIHRFLYDDECNSLGSIIEGEIVRRFKMRSVSTVNSTLTVAGHSISGQFIETREVVREGNTTISASVTEEASIGSATTTTTTAFESQLSELNMTAAAPTPVAPSYRFSGSAITAGGLFGHTAFPGLGSWKTPAAAHVYEHDGVADVYILPSETPAGPAPATSFTIPGVTPGSFSVHGSRGAFNPLTGIVMRDGADNIYGSI